VSILLIQKQVPFQHEAVWLGMWFVRGSEICFVNFTEWKCLLLIWQNEDDLLDVCRQVYAISSYLFYNGN
jgi:hypothetical protein